MKTFHFRITKKLTLNVFIHDLTRQRGHSPSVKPVPRLQLGDSLGSRENVSIRQWFKIRYNLKIDNFKKTLKKIKDIYN